MDDCNNSVSPPSRTQTLAHAPTAAAATETLTQAPPIQAPASGGGREDCWSEGATCTLIDAWGERFLLVGRGSLRQQQWQEVADAVAARDGYAKTPRTDSQCKNRIDTLKKKYKSELSKILSGQSHSSTWRFFHRLDRLLNPNPSPSFPPKFPKKLRTKKLYRSRSPTPVSAASAGSGGPGELTRAMLRLGEAYEKVERWKSQQAAEMERRRLGFVRELELQRMRFFAEALTELSQARS